MIRGKKVLLRAVEEQDLPKMVQWMNDPDIGHLVGGWTFPISLAQQKEWFKTTLGSNTTQRFIIETPEGEAIGLTGLWDIDWHNRHALVSFKLGEEAARGKGYGTDAIMTVLSYAFYQVGLNRAWSEILPFNTASYAVLVEKCGWRVEGVYRQHIYRDGKYYDQLRVAVLKQDFDVLPAAADYIPRPDDRRPPIKPEHVTFDRAAFAQFRQP